MTRRLAALVLGLASIGVALWFVARPEPEASAPRAAAPSAPSAPPVLGGEVDGTAPATTAPREAVDTGAVPSAYLEELAVRVVEPGGAPAARVRLVLTTNRGLGGRRLRGTTGVDGVGRLELPPGTPVPGEVAHLALTPPAPFRAMEWSGPFPTAQLELVLHVGGTLSGAVRYGPDLEPVAEGHLGVRSRLDGQRAERETPIVDGRYEIAGVAGEVYELYLFCPGQRLLHRRVELAVPDGGALQHDVTFFRGASLEVTVLDALDGSPVADAAVRVPYSRHGTTDTEGRAVLEQTLDADRSARVKVSHAAYQPLDVGVLAQAGTQHVTRTVELHPALALEGVVRDSRGAPQAGVQVECLLQELSASGRGSRRFRFRSQTTTDAEGHFLVAGLPECANLDVVFRRSAGGVPYGETIAVYTIDLPADADRREWIVDDPVTVSGVVLDGAGRPAEGRTVRATSRRGIAAGSTTTGSGGGFALPGLFPGPWSITVAHERVDFGDGTSSPRLTAVALDVGPAGRGDVRIQLPNVEPVALGRLDLTVSDAGTALPIETPFALVLLGGVDYEASRELVGTALDGGQRRFWLPAGRWDLWLWHDDYESFQHTLELTGDEPLAVRARLQRRP
jgi:hypothetical protein